MEVSNKNTIPFENPLKIDASPLSKSSIKAENLGKIQNELKNLIVNKEQIINSTPIKSATPINLPIHKLIFISEKINDPSFNIDNFNKKLRDLKQNLTPENAFVHVGNNEIRSIANLSPEEIKDLKPEDFILRHIDEKGKSSFLAQEGYDQNILGNSLYYDVEGKLIEGHQIYSVPKESFAELHESIQQTVRGYVAYRLTQSKSTKSKQKDFSDSDSSLVYQKRNTPRLPLAHQQKMKASAFENKNLINLSKNLVLAKIFQMIKIIRDRKEQAVKAAAKKQQKFIQAQEIKEDNIEFAQKKINIKQNNSSNQEIKTRITDAARGRFPKKPKRSL